MLERGIIMKETRARSIIKSVTWRVTATIATIIIVYLFTGHLTIALSVGIIEVITKLLIYYFHERAWATIKWGITK